MLIGVLMRMHGKWLIIALSSVSVAQPQLAVTVTRRYATSTTEKRPTNLGRTRVGAGDMCDLLYHMENLE